MADDVATAATANKPLDHLADTERALDAGRPAGADPVAAGPAPEAQDYAHAPDNPGPLTAADRLRAFEDEHLGEECVRIGGQIERGSGSPYQALSDDHKRQYAALEKLVAAEQALDVARGAAAQAEADCAAAAAHVDECAKALDAAPAE